MHRSGNTVSKHAKGYASWDDAALVQALQRGDAHAFAEIYARYGLHLLEQAYRKVNSREAAEEMVQDLFATLWHKRETAAILKLKEYLGTAIKYQVINHIKNKLTQQQFLAYSRVVLREADHRTEHDLAAADLSGALARGLARLPSHTRQIFQLSRMEHQTVPQIAGRLQLSPKAVEYHLTRALKMLRVSLKDFLVPTLSLFCELIRCISA